MKQETKKILSAEEIKKEGKKRDQKAGKTRDLWMFTDIYVMQCIKTYATARSYSFQIQKKYKLTS